MLDKDSKFFGTCSEALDLLKINRHVLLRSNHNPMLVERVNCYLTKGLKSCATNAIPSEWHWRPSCSCCMHGTLALCPARIYLAVWLPSARSLRFLSTSPADCTGSSLPCPALLCHIQKNCLHACLHVVRSHSFWWRNSARTIVSLLTRAALILTPTLLATSSLLDVQLGWMPSIASSTNFGMHTQAPGKCGPS